MRFIKLWITLAAIAGVIAYGATEEENCLFDTQIRVACEDFDGFCSIFAWNFKIYYAKYYKCCYDQSGQWISTDLVHTSGPTPPTEGDCCQSLVYVGWEDWKWTMPCPRLYSTPFEP